MSGYEEQELTAIDAALDANPDATSNEVFQATRPYDERAIASVAASRALSGGGGSSPFLTASLTLTHDDILALVTTPIEIVPAPGAGKALLPLLTTFVADVSAGVYTNFNIYDPSNLWKSSVFLVWDAANWFNDATGPVSVQTLLGTDAHKHLGYALPIQGPTTQVVFGPIFNGSLIHGQVGGDGVRVDLGYDNAPLHVVGQNNSLGDFTGGDPANTLKVNVIYIEIDL